MAIGEKMTLIGAAEKRRFHQWNVELRRSFTKYSETDANRDAERLARAGEFRWYEPVRIDYKEVSVAMNNAGLDQDQWD